MEVTIFEFSEYKPYLKEVLGRPGQRTGLRARAAKAMGCQTAYVSQVLNGAAHFNLEQTILLSKHLGHSSQEEDYFLNLVQLAKAGNQELRDFCRKKNEVILSEQRQIKNRVGSQTQLSFEDQTQYYSQWYYSAFHMLATMAELKTREEMARYLSLPISTVSEALEFLERAGIVEATEKGYRSGSTKMHLGNDSSNIQKHHTNWRIKAIQALEKEQALDLHYSVVFSVSEKDVVRIREKLLKTIQESLKVVESSGEEEVCCLAMDLFGLRRG